MECFFTTIKNATPQFCFLFQPTFFLYVLPYNLSIFLSVAHIFSATLQQLYLLSYWSAPRSKGISMDGYLWLKGSLMTTTVRKAIQDCHPSKGILAFCCFLTIARQTKCTAICSIGFYWKKNTPTIFLKFLRHLGWRQENRYICVYIHICIWLCICEK